MALVVGANSYISVTDADLYFLDRLYSDTWTAATEATKAQALIMATKRIERVPMMGIKADAAQTLNFPRAYAAGAFLAYDRRGEGYTHDLIPGYTAQTSPPQAVLDAVCEEALALLDHGNSTRTKLQRQGVQSASVVGISETYTAGAGRGLLSQEARELIAPYKAGAVGIC